LSAGGKIPEIGLTPRAAVVSLVQAALGQLGELVLLMAAVVEEVPEVLSLGMLSGLQLEWQPG
jgi:hypothetical protein